MIDFMFIYCIQNITYRQISSFSFPCSKDSLDSSTWIVSQDTKVLRGLKFFVRTSPAPVGICEILPAPAPHPHTSNLHPPPPADQPNPHLPRSFSALNPQLSVNY